VDGNHKIAHGRNARIPLTRNLETKKCKSDNIIIIIIIIQSLRIPARYHVSWCIWFWSVL